MLKTITPRRILAVLKRKGFTLKRVRGSHYVFQHLINKRRVIVPMHKRDLPKGTLHSILERAGLSIDDL